MLKSLFKNSRKELTKIINYPTRGYCKSVIRQACFNFTAVFFGKIFQSFIRKAVVQNIVLCLFYFIFNRKAYAAKEKLSLFAQIKKTFRTKWKNLKIRFLHIVAEIFPKNKNTLQRFYSSARCFFVLIILFSVAVLL